MHHMCIYIYIYIYTQYIGGRPRRQLGQYSERSPVEATQPNMWRVGATRPTLYAKTRSRIIRKAPTCTTTGNTHCWSSLGERKRRSAAGLPRPHRGSQCCRCRSGLLVRDAQQLRWPHIQVYKYYARMNPHLNSRAETDPLGGSPGGIPWGDPLGEIPGGIPWEMSGGSPWDPMGGHKSRSRTLGGGNGFAHYYQWPCATP